MSLQTLIDKTSKRLGLGAVTTVIGSTNEDVILLLELANEEGEELANRYQWSRMLRKNSWTMTVAADQGLLNSTVVTDGDFDYVINNTMWDETTDIPIYGALPTHTYAAETVLTSTGPYIEYKIYGGRLYFYPAPSTANTASFWYKSTWWCEDSGGNGQDAWSADTDVGRLDERLMIQGLRWRYKKTKGLDYQEDFVTYERRVADAIGRDGGKSLLRMNPGSFQRRPGVLLPKGSWNL